MTLTCRLACGLLGCALLLAGPARALTFDEDYAEDFVEITVDGIKFTADPAGSASFGSGFWFDASYVYGRALEIDSNASVTVDLPAPAAYLEFGAAVGDENGVLTDLATITAYDSNGLELLPDATNEPFPGFGLGDAERQYMFFERGVRRLVFSYDFSGQNVLAIDNLVYQPIPEPATWMLVLAGSALVIARRARRVFDV